jgi:hypothetical protein
MKKSAVFLATILFLTGATAYDQSLGELAKEEQKRREAVTGKIITIDNVSSDTAAPNGEALTDEEFGRMMVEASNEINKTLPMMRDSELRWDMTAALPNKTWMAGYSFVNYSIDDFNLEEFKDKMRPRLLNYIKTSINSKIFKDYKATFVVVVKDKDGHEFFTLSFGYDDYKE